MSYVFTDKRLFPVHLLGFVDPTDHYAYNGILTESGELRKYESFEELITQITQRRQALGYEQIAYLDLKVQQYLYMVGEAHKSQFALNADIPRTMKEDILVGARVALELSRQALTGIYTAGATGWATMQVAEERAKTCINCPKNVALKKSPLQRMNDKIAQVFSLKRETPHDAKLFDCEVCGCPLQSKVHFSDATILEATPEKYKPTDFPDTFVGLLDKERYACWMRKILETGKTP